MTAILNFRSVSSPESLCRDAPIGRVLVPARRAAAPIPVYLSVDIQLSWRSTRRDKVVDPSRGYRFSGTLPVLGIQLILRAFGPDRPPFRFVDGLGEPGDCAPGQFQPRAGILADILRLGELSQQYNRNMRTHVNAPPTVVFIPREHERELRDIAARLARGHAVR